MQKHNKQTCSNCRKLQPHYPLHRHTWSVQHPALFSTTCSMCSVAAANDDCSANQPEPTTAQDSKTGLLPSEATPTNFRQPARRKLTALQDVARRQEGMRASCNIGEKRGGHTKNTGACCCVSMAGQTVLPNDNSAKANCGTLPACNSRGWGLPWPGQQQQKMNESWLVQ